MRDVRGCGRGAYRPLATGTAWLAVLRALTRRALAAREPGQRATDRKIRPSVRAFTVIWLVIIQWPSCALNTCCEPYAK